MTTPASQSRHSIKLFSRDYTFSLQSILSILIAAAILLRLASAFLHGNTVSELPGVFDQVSYDSLARRLIDGYGFSFAERHWPITGAGEPTAHWSFLYTFYLAGVYALVGPQPVVARLLQALLVGGLQTYIIYRIGEKTFSRNAGLIAAGISAFYIYFIYYAGALMTEPFYITAILYSLYLAIAIAENTEARHDLKLGAALGIAVGVTVLLRQVFLLFIPFMFLWIWIARYRRSRRLPILSTVVSISLIILCIVPISLYNQSRFGRFVLLNTNSGYAFFWGNHPIYGTKFIPILRPEMASYQQLIPEDVRHLDEAALDQELLKRGLQFVIDDPGRYVLLSLSRIPPYFMFWPSSESSLISNISRVGSFGLVFPFMLYGLILGSRKKRGEEGNHLLNLIFSPAGLLIMFALIYTIIHLLTWTLIRYRLPVDAVLMPFAAIALLDVFHRLTRKTGLREANERVPGHQEPGHG